jgi:hypothetical protein
VLVQASEVRQQLVQETKAVLITKDGRVQIGTQSAPLPASAALAQLSKGEARKVRKALRDAGFADEAGIGAETRKAKE